MSNQETVPVIEQAFYQAILDNVQDGIWVTDKNDIMIYFNPSMEKIAGVGAEDVLGLRLTHEFPNETIRYFIEFYNAAKETLEPQQYEAEVVTPAGRHTIQAGWLIPRLKEGRYNGMICSIQDITERKRAEAALRESERKYRYLYETMTQGVVLQDTDGKIIEANPAAAEVLGLSMEQMLGKTAYDPRWRLIHEDGSPYDPDDMPSNIALRTGRAVKDVVCGIYVPEQDAYRWIMIDSTPQFREGESEPFVTMTVFTDITKRKQAEEALRESEERLRLAHKATNDVVWDWDIFNDAQRWNEAGTVVFGWTEIVERPVTAAWWVARVHPDDRQRVDEGFFAVVNDPEATYWYDEYRFLKADGSYADVMDRGYVLRNERGEALRMIGAMHDITERKRAEETIKRQLQEKDILLREVHHRIRNNIASIAGLLSLQANTSKSPEAQAVLREAVNRVYSIRTLYDKLLGTEDYAEVSVKAYLEDLIASIARILPQDVAVTLNHDIAAFNLDPNKLFSLGLIVNELLTNCIKYGFKDRASGTIDIILVQHAQEISLTVQDDGRGFPENFDLQTSTGFGLRLVQMLTRQLGGIFTINSDHGARSVVTFGV